MSHIDQGPLPAYNSLADHNLTGYFANTRMRSHLRRSGLITKRGEIVSENTYRLNMGRKEHKKHVKDMLAQAIVHKTLDLERARQAEIRRKLEEIAKIELVRRVRASRDRKRENYVLPLVSPRRDKESCQSSTTSGSTSRPVNRRRATRSAGSPKRKGKRPFSALSSNYDDENETVVYLDDEGRPISPAHVDRSDLKYSSKEPIDTRHLYSLDTAALRKYAMLMAKMEQGRGGLSSPYLIPQVPLPPKSPRSGRAPLSAQRQRSSSDAAKSLSPKRPSTAGGQAYLHPSAGPKQVRGQSETMCEVFMEYHGSSLSLVREQFDKRQDVIIEQQHCGGNTLTVFRDKMEAGTKFSFISYRHRGYPFSLSIYVDGRMDCRVSVCCEHRHSKGGRIGGKKGHFSICSISGAVPCYKCQVEKGIRVKSAAPRRKLKRPPQPMEEVTVVESTRKEKEEVDEPSEPVEERSEEILVPVEDDDEKKSNTGAQNKSDADYEYDSDDFDSSSSESEKEGNGLENFMPKDARGVDKTTGRVDLNDSTEEEEQEDKRANAPTPNGRKKMKKKKKGEGRRRSVSSSSSASSSSSGSSSDTAKEGSGDEKDGKKDEEKEEIKKEEVGRFHCPPLVATKSDKTQAETEVQAFVAEPEKEETTAADKEDKKEGDDYQRRVSISSSSSSSSSNKDGHSSDDYSESKKDEVKSKDQNKEVDMGEENENKVEEEEERKETPVPPYERPETSMKVEQATSQELLQAQNARYGNDGQREEEEEEKRSASVLPPISTKTEEAEEKKEKDNDAASVASSSSASPSSSSGSATIHDKGPNTVNDPTMTLDDMWNGQKGTSEQEQETTVQAEEEEVKEKPKVTIIREDLNKKQDSGSSSDSSSSDESDSDQSHKKVERKTSAEVHQSESQPESDPEATHGGNDPDNVANGNDSLGSRSFEPAVPEKAKPGSILPLLEASQTTLEIKGVTLNKSQVYEVAEFLEHKNGITNINLVNCGIDDDDVQKLMEALRQSPSRPVMINLGLNPLTVESVSHILTACKRKPSIEGVLLQGTRLGDDGVNALVAGIMAQLQDWKMRGESIDQGIHELDLSDCKFGDQGALGIARLLTSEVDLDTLTLTHNHAISSDGWKVIGDGLKLNRKLETLTLDHNYIGDSGIEYITQGLFDNASVTAIDLNDVGLTDKGGNNIMELLKRNTYLLEITVMENKLSEEMIENIQRYISLNKASMSPK